jgi:hypothetical protein
MGVVLAADGVPSTVPWWLWLAVLVVVGVIAWAFTTRRPGVTSDDCQKCGHAAGLDDQKKHCGGGDAHAGWGRDTCTCKNDYHWNYESTSPTSA